MEVESLRFAILYVGHEREKTRITLKILSGAIPYLDRTEGFDWGTLILTEFSALSRHYTLCLMYLEAKCT